MAKALRLAGVCALLGGGVLVAGPPAQAAADYPHIPEPMVFDMIRPLGARQGELESNVLASNPLSGPQRSTEWAPEVEYAFADGLAIEFEFPFENDRLTEYKLGLQGTFGTFNRGRSVHGVQYLGIHERGQRSWQSSLVYMLGHRFNARWSTMSMLGVSDVDWSTASKRNALLVNHATFYDLGERSVLGLEFNYRSGPHGNVLLMPQFHRRLSHALNLQLGVGLNRQRGDSAHPQVALRLVREF